MHRFFQILPGLVTVFLLPSLALAAPGLPHQFYGAVNFSNGPPPDGIALEARIGSSLVTSTVTKDGTYGFNPSLFFVTDPDGDRSGQTITFFVGGIDSGVSQTFVNGGYTKKDLDVQAAMGTISKNADDIVENQSILITPTNPTTIQMGSSLVITISSTSQTTATIEKIEKLAANFFSGAQAVLAGNNVLNGYEISIKGTGVTISVTMNYDDAGIDETTVAPYQHNGTSWINLTPFTIDKSANTVTFEITSAATPYALFGQLSPPPPPPPAPPGGGGGGESPSSPPSVEVSETPAPITGGGGVIPPAPAASQKVDTNKDGKVDILDFNALMVHWGALGANVADFNSDGKVDILDFNLLMVYWTG